MGKPFLLSLLKLRLVYVLALLLMVSLYLNQNRLQADGQGGDGDDDSGDSKDCCPLELVDLRTQDGSWDPSKLTQANKDESYNPFTADPNGPASISCAEPDCDEFRIPDELAHSVSIEPLGHMPQSSGNAAIAGNVIPVKYVLRVENEDLLPMTVQLLACMESSNFRGDSGNSDGALKGGEPDPPLVDASFNHGIIQSDDNPDGDWKIVEDEQCTDINSQGDRPQQISRTVVLKEGESEFSDELLIDCFDSRMYSAVMVSATIIPGINGGGDDDGNGGSYGGGGSSWEDDDSGGGDGGDDDDGSIEAPELQPVGRYVVTDTDQDGLWDETEIRYNGFAPNLDPDNPGIDFNTGFEAGFWDSNNEFHHPDPEKANTVDLILDSLQDSELGFNEVVNPNWKKKYFQKSKGDGVTAAAEQGGFVVQKSPVHPDSGSQVPIRLWEMVDYVDFENTIVPAKEYIGKVKKLFYRVESEELAELITPQFYDENITASISESMGTIPIRVLSNHTFPAESDPQYDLMVVEMYFQYVKDLYGEEFTGNIELNHIQGFGGGINFNNGPDYIHPFIGERDVCLDPSFTAIMNCVDGSDELNHSNYLILGRTKGFNYQPPDQPRDPLFQKPKPYQLVSAVFNKHDQEFACLGHPILFNRNLLEKFQEESESYIDATGLKSKYFSLLTTLHESTHKLARWMVHGYNKLDMGSDLDPLADVAQQTDFSDGITRQSYYKITLNDGKDYIACWQLMELHDTKKVQSVGHYHYLIIPGPPHANNLMQNLVNTSEEEAGQGVNLQFKVEFSGYILVPEVFYDQNTNTIGQGRYWFLVIYTAEGDFDPSKKPPLYLRNQILTQDLNSDGFFTDPQSVLQPENMGQDPELYKDVDLQRLSGLTGYVEVDLDG